MNSLDPQVTSLLARAAQAYRPLPTDVATVLATSGRDALEVARQQASQNVEMAEKALAPYRRAAGVSLLLAFLAVCLFSVQFFGSAMTLLAAPGYPHIGVTTVVALGLSYLAYRLWAKCERLWVAGPHELQQQLLPLTVVALQRMEQRTEHSSSAVQWMQHVKTVLQRDYCVGDARIVDSLATADSNESALTARERLLQAPSTLDAGNAVGVEGLLRLAQPVDSSDRDIPLVELLTTAEEELSVRHREATQLRDEDDAAQSKWMDPLFLWGARFLWLAPLILLPIVWQAYTLSPAPAWVVGLAFLGLFGILFFGLCTSFDFERFGTLSKIQRERQFRRALGLRPLDGAGCHEMLKYLDSSEIARAWHHHVTQVMGRQYLVEDLLIVRSLVHRSRA